MIFTTETIASVLPKLNNSWYLPSLQREFVWGTERVCELFDSLMRAYPISSLLTWRVPEAIREEVEAYRFLNQGSDFGAHNARERAYGADDLIFVLDGQQRLTSLLIGLKGTYEVRKKYARTAESQRLHLDLLRDGEAADDQGQVWYGFEFRANSTTASRASEWFEVGRILRYDRKLDALLEETKLKLGRHHLNEHEIDCAIRNLTRLYCVVYEEESLTYHTEIKGDQERMLEIFVRANSGGEPLSKSDLLLSNLTVHWKGMNAREEIKGFVDELNDKINRGLSKKQSKAALSQDFVLKACLVLLDLPVAYRISSFNKATCDRISECWSELKEALTQTIEATSWFGITGPTLTSANALIPIAYYLFRNPETRLMGEGKDSAANAQAVRKWLIMALLNGVFGGSSDSMLSKLRESLKRHGENGRVFPVIELDSAIRQAKRIPSTDKEAVKNILDFKYGKPVTRLAQTLLFEERSWGVIPHDCDHIFPQDGFKHFRQFRDMADNFGNLTLLSASANNEKRAVPFEEWICTQEAAFLERHLIPQIPELWRFEKFPDFLKERQLLILDRLYKVLSGS
jgi:Protein of unknown function DUF262/Protein of unknown function (DUF1524)